MKQYTNIYDFIKGEEANFDRSIDLNGWQWNMKQHIKTTFFYMHGRLLNGNDDNTPVKNIIRRLVKLQKTEQDIDVTDIQIYVDDPKDYHLSFLIKKYHDDVFVVENDIDTFIDDWLDSRITYGGGLAKKGKSPRPDVIDLQSIAFCDQTDLLKGPLAFKYYYNPSELKDMEASGWGKETNGASISIDDLILLSENERESAEDRENATPGAYIEIYEVHGVLPTAFLKDNEDYRTYKRQFQIIGFYQTKDGEKKGVCLFRKEQAESALKTTLRDKIYSRALGFGGAEEIFEDQVWTNYDVIRKKELLDATSKIILKAVGASLKSRYPNGLKDVDNLQIIELSEGEDLAQIDTTPRSMALFDRDISEWETHAQGLSFATDPLLGNPAPSGTPFRAQERQVIQAKGPHQKEQGKYAKDLENVYRDWFIPHIMDKITEGTRFLSKLSTEEMNYISDKIAENMVNKHNWELLFSGQIPLDEKAQQAEKERIKNEFSKQGNNKFIEILKGEFKDKKLSIKINIANKQKDLARVTDALVNIFRQIMANPQGFVQMMQVPQLAQTFNRILENSGFSPILYAGLEKTAAFQPPPPTAPLTQQPSSQNPQAQQSLTG